MALARVKTWVAGNVLTANDLNAEFNSILSNPISLISPSTGPINFALQPNTNFVVENLGADPTAATTGRLFYNTVRKQLEIDDGGFIRAVPTVLATAISANGVILGSTFNSFGLGTIAALAQGSRVMGLTGGSSSLGVTSTWAIGQYAVVKTTDDTASFLFRSTTGFNVNVDTATTAATAGARDQASTFSSTGQFAYVYLITTGVGSTTPAGIASLTPPPSGPAMPSSYSAWAFLAPVFYTTNSVLVSQLVRGSTVVYTSGYVIATTANAVATTAAQSHSLSTAIPPNAMTYVPHITGYPVNSGQTKFRLQSSAPADIEEYLMGSAAGVVLPNNLAPICAVTTGRTLNYAVDSSMTVSVNLQSYSVSNGAA